MTDSKQLLLRFLKDNQIYNSFIKNYYLISGISFRQKFLPDEVATNLRRYIRFYQPISIAFNYFENAFSWEKTKEGSEFWENINHLWLCYLIENYKSESDTRWYQQLVHYSHYR